MNLTSHQPSVRPVSSITVARAVMALLVFGAALAASNPAMAQALEPVVRGATAMPTAAIPRAVCWWWPATITAACPRRWRTRATSP